MKLLRNMLSVLAFSATAALLGVACTSSGAPVNGGATVGSVEETRIRPLAFTPGGRRDRGGGGRGCAVLQDGAYCGGNGVRGDRNTLYRCLGGRQSVIEVCPNACLWQPRGVPDRCL
jgi:hypothetical protein